MTKEQFIQEVAKYVQKYAPKYGIAVCSPIIAQACLESAYGTSELAVNANNYFGLKYTSRAANNYYTKNAIEQNPDGSYRVANGTHWCKYNSLEEGIEGYFKFINTTRYNNLKGEINPQMYLEKIRSDGYATSLKYVQNNMNVINLHGLTKYDNNSTVAIPTTTGGIIYRVQVGAYKDKTNADALIQELKSKNINAITVSIGGLYKVQAGAYSHKENADAQLALLKSLGYKAFITQ